VRIVQNIEQTGFLFLTNIAEFHKIIRYITETGS